MKKMRRFAAIAAAAAMTACMAVPMMSMMSASATTISVTNSQANKDFSAYRILTASVNSEEEAYVYNLNDKYDEILFAVTGKTTETDVLAYIKGLDDDGMTTFANAVYNKILVGSIAADATTDENGVFDVGEKQGYYLIAENIENLEVDGTASLVMVDTAGDVNISVEVKKDLPEFDKQIGDICDTEKAVSATWNADNYEWREDADHDKYASDEVPFRLIATLPTDYDSYNHYTLTFHDDLQAGVYGEVTADDIKAVYFVNKEGDVTAIDSANYVFGDGCGKTHSTTHGNGCDFTLTIKDLSITAATAGDKVYVEYTAPFTGDTIVGSAGNWNTALLEYSNNPYNSGYDKDDNTTSKTVEDSVVAFTYTVKINKVKASDGSALAGAKFKLEKKTTTGNVLVKAFTAETDTVFTFEGLDDGTYILTETEPPQGYNPIEAIEFKVEATHEDEALTDLNGTPTKAGEISFTPDKTAGSLSANVKNSSGTQLPSTGGIGTTLFYVIGGTMAAGAGVALIAKKRMKNEE